MKVYIVSDGEYSDYRILAICTTLEKAEEMQAFYGADNEIWAQDTDPTPTSLGPPGLHLWTGNVSVNGKSWVFRRHDNDEPNALGHNDTYYPNRTGCQLEFTCSIWARDEQHALKILSERRTAAILANDLKCRQESSSSS